MSNHQHTLIIDGTSGISGDMTVAALLDLGASEEHLREQLATLPVDGFSISVTRVNKHGIDACDFDVQLAEELENHDHDMAWLYGNETAAEHTHEHEHEHHHHDHDEHEHCHEHDHETHGHGHEGHHHAHHHHHRSLADVTAIIDGSQLSDGTKRRALAIFTALAAAEAKAHGKTPETVMFHEVGAVDSIVDVCSVAICLDDLGIEDIVVESLSEGHGTIRCAHGLMPIPVPAVVNLCQAGNIALTPAPVAGELVTPTGAAIVTALRTSDQLPSRYRIEAVGYGAGARPKAAPRSSQHSPSSFARRTTARSPSATSSLAPMWVEPRSTASSRAKMTCSLSSCATSAPMPSTMTVRPSMTHSCRSSISSTTSGIVVRVYAPS